MKHKHEIFSVPVFEFELDKEKYELDTEELKEFVETFKNLPSRSAVYSNIGGFQSTDLPLDKPCATWPLVNAIEQTLNDSLLFERKGEKGFDRHFKNYQIVYNMWFNINKKNDSNSSHFHPFSIYSGVYYLETPENCGYLQFEHPALDLLHYYSRGEGGVFRFPAEENKMYVFPSWLKHSVTPNQSEEERISFSFNTKNGV